MSLWRDRRQQRSHLLANIVLAVAAGGAIGVAVAAALGRVTGT